MFPEESVDEEILPEDMIADDSQIDGETQESVVLQDEQIEQVLSEMELGVEDYQSMYTALYQVVGEIRKSLVTVTGVNADVDIFNNTYENGGSISGIIIADNGREMLILAKTDSIEDADSIRVTFCDGRQNIAEIKRKDKQTGLSVLAVNKTTMRTTTKEAIKIIDMGSSSSASLVGSPVMALGNPLGTTDSVCYGMVTSAARSLYLPDVNYKLVTTDIYGSDNATGVLVNMHGQVVGIIDNSFNSTNATNLVSAIGITELKKVIQQLSNDAELSYLGVYGADVTLEANEEMGVPYGAYVMEIEMDSPAMNAGIQSGDIIVSVDNTDITSYTELVNLLTAANPEETLEITIMRQGPDGYAEMKVEVTLRAQK